MRWHILIQRGYASIEHRGTFNKRQILLLLGSQSMRGVIKDRKGTSLRIPRPLCKVFTCLSQTFWSKRESEPITFPRLSDLSICVSVYLCMCVRDHVNMYVSVNVQNVCVGSSLMV